MKRLPLARNFLAYSLLTLTALLVASCSSSSDSPTAENPDTTFRASETRQNTQLPPSTNLNSTSATTETSPTFSGNRTPANKAPAITAGDRISCAFLLDDPIFCWENNESDQLGNETDTWWSWLPAEVADITDASAITAGSSHSCALREGGTISCWGRNEDGQLGNKQRGDDLVSSVPVQVIGIVDAKAVSAGDIHSCALRESGTISCWGSNWGQLGNGQSGDDAYSLVPVEVEGVTDATAITTSWGHSCALHQTGTISCWGSNFYGQLGNGTDTDSSTPVQILSITDAKAVSAGFRHSCALHQGGTISCWGYNNRGQLGNGTDTDSQVPMEVADITDATAITAGGYHSCALREGGTISCWGNNGSGQLGNGTDTWISSVPVEVVSITDATAINAGYEHSCALHQGGTISCWGYNNRGRLGNGTDTDSQVPVEVADIADATAITTGDEHSCALREGGTISCWGDNYFGQLGDGRSLP